MDLVATRINLSQNVGNFMPYVEIEWPDQKGGNQNACTDKT